MKISYNWLKDHLPALDLGPQKVAHLLTMSGLEVESVEEFESIKGGLKGVVVGEVLTKTQHPNADRLSLTTVNVGDKVLNIVCGASNVAAGQKVLVATPGATLYTFSGDSIEIKKSKIRGEASEGMICAEDELGLGESHEGIMVLDPSTEIGKPAADLFNLQSDFVLEIGLTPNRTDAMSHYGVARDLRAVMLAEGMADPGLVKGNTTRLEPGGADLAVVENHNGAPRYSAVSFSSVKVQESPEWLKNRLVAAGIKPINNVVDVTNYVMLETGQPLHAFDMDKISGGRVRVMNLAEGKPFITLDGVERKLSAEDLMICNAEGEPLCIAGVYGGLNSGVSPTTSKVLLESAWFDSVYIRKTAKRHALKTDASYRFERGTDPEGTIPALERAAFLLQELAGAKVSSNVTDLYPAKAEPFNVRLNIDRVRILTGVEIPKKEIRSILESLEIRVVTETAEEMVLEIPRFKSDVQREADVVEEILRVYGYNKVPVPAKINASLQFSKGVDKEKVIETISNVLTGAGLTEALNNSLTKARYQEFTSGDAVGLLNPLSSELQNMRTSLLFPLLENLVYNINRKNESLKFFEFGKTYLLSSGRYKESEKLAIIITGRQQPDTWLHPSTDVSYFTLKGLVTGLLEKLNLRGIIEQPVESKILSDSLELFYEKLSLGLLGEVRSSILKSLDIDQVVYYAELDLQVLIKKHGESKVVFSELPRFPEVRRDLALLIDEDISYNLLQKAAFETERRLLKKVDLFDVYRGKNLEPGKKSYALSFILRDENATLNDKQIDKVMANLQRVYTEKFGAKIR